MNKLNRHNLTADCLISLKFYVVTDYVTQIMLVSGRPRGNVSAHITSNRLNGQLGEADTRHVFTEHFKSFYQPNTSNADLDFANKLY